MPNWPRHRNGITALTLPAWAWRFFFLVERWAPFVVSAYDYDRSGSSKGGLIWLSPWGYVMLLWERFVCAIGRQKGHDWPAPPEKAALTESLEKARKTNAKSARLIRKLMDEKLMEADHGTP